MKRRKEKISPFKLFQETSFLGIDLAKEFVKARLQVENGSVKAITEGEGSFFGRNAGAIEATSGDQVFRTHGFSQPKFNIGRKSHTERVLMSDALDSLILENFSEGGIRRPSEMVKSLKNKNKERLQVVTENASGFSKFLDSTGSVVKMFSERVPCGGKTGCNQFLDNILPETEGTAVGFFTEKISEFDGAPQLLKELTLGVEPGKKSVQGVLPLVSLQKVYQRYLDQNIATGTQKFRDLPKPSPITSLEDNVVKVFDVRNSATGRGDNILSKLVKESRNTPLPNFSPFDSPSSESVVSSPEEFVVEVEPGVFITRTIPSPSPTFNNTQFNSSIVEEISNTPTFRASVSSSPRRNMFSAPNRNPISIPFGNTTSVVGDGAHQPTITVNGMDLTNTFFQSEATSDQTQNELSIIQKAHHAGSSTEG